MKTCYQICPRNVGRGGTRGSEVPSVIYVGWNLGVELRVCMCLCMRACMRRGKFELAGVNVATRECGIL